VNKGGFWSMPDEEKITFFMRMPEGTDIRVVSETMEKFEALILPLDPGVTMKTQVFGNSAFMEVEYEDELKRGPIPYFHRNSLVELADNTGGSRIFIGGFSDQPYFRGGMMGNSSNSLIKLTGYNSKRLNELAEGVLEVIQGNRRVREPRITTDTRWGATQLEETVVTLRRDALAAKSLAVSDVVLHLQRLLGVDRIQNMVISGEQERVKLSYSDAEEIQYSDVASQVITSPSGERVRLLDLVDLSVQPMSSWIEREDSRYTMMVNWEYIGTDRMRRGFLQGVLDTIELPYGYTAEEGRQEFLTEEEEQNLQLTLLLALIFIFMVLAAMFESASLPFLVLSSVPMALFGVVMIFWWSSATFDSSARIGLVLLFGVVVNNAILLVERFRREAERTLKVRLGGEPAEAAALFAGRRQQLGGSDLWLLDKEERVRQLWRAVSRGTLIKMRSILLTSGTTVVGLLPLLIKVQDTPWAPKWLFGLSLPWTLRWMDSENQDIWENLALSTVGGVVSSTLFLLLAMPALYYVSVRFGWWIRGSVVWMQRLARRIRTRRQPAGEPLAPA
jgi:HAE1 family hydrophobic/amphiphilic exporter-1